MFINLSEVFTSEGKTEEKQLTVEVPSFSWQGNVYAVLETSPLALKLCNIGQGAASVSGSMELVLLMPCDRCLSDVKVPMELSFFREVFAPERAEACTEEQLDDQNVMDGYQLDIKRLIDNEILLNWPVKVLCREDCRGICSVCGRNLNTGSCDCDTFVPDPRMAKIKDIFHAGRHDDKEV